MKNPWAVIKVYKGKSRNGEVEVLETHETEEKARAAATKYTFLHNRAQPFILIVSPTNQVGREVA